MESRAGLWVVRGVDRAQVARSGKLAKTTEIDNGNFRAGGRYY